MTSTEVINDLYAGLSEEVRSELAGQVETATLPRGAKLVQPGIAPDHLIILDSGTVETSVEVRGKNLSLGVFGPGHVFALHSIVSHELPHTTVTCLEDCEVSMLPSHVFLELLERHPQVYVVVAKVLSADLAKADHLLRDRARSRKIRPGRRALM
jgi:CRP-like cAMP-binding protein